MTTTTRRSRYTEHHPLDPAGAQAVDVARTERSRDGPLPGSAPAGPLPGSAPDVVVASVHRVEPPWPVAPLAWGDADGLTIVFRIDEPTAAALREALEAGESPNAIVEPDQIVAMEVRPR
jgi:hypothetical protein